MKINKKLFGLILGLLIVFSPVVPFYTASAEPIVPKCNTGKLILKIDKKTGKPVTNANGKPTGEKTFAVPCDFNYVMILINNLIFFFLFVIATPLAAIVICYAGFLLLTSGGSSESKTKAKHIIKNLIVGYLIALAAWLIVKTIFSTLGFKGETFLKG